MPLTIPFLQPFASRRGRLIILLIAIAAVLAFSATEDARAQGSVKRRVNVPYTHLTAPDVPIEEAAVFWFGAIDPTGNYADGRVIYNDETLYVVVHVIDRRLWYDLSPAATDLEKWDAATLYLHEGTTNGTAPTTASHRFVAQVNHVGSREDYQAAYQGDGSGWAVASTPFTTATGWRGDGVNDGADDRGWYVSFRIPFSSLGLTAAPEPGTIWSLAVAVHDRDDQAGTAIADRRWPPGSSATSPATWGELHFGLPTYYPPPIAPAHDTLVRQGLNGATVSDGHVGGHSLCGSGLNFWTEWGNTNYAGYHAANVQNQWDIADWPCFSKYYVTFPLDAVPPGQEIAQATLVLHQFGSAGDGVIPATQTSPIQVLTIGDLWNEGTLTWNNAPLAQENISTTWVAPLQGTGYPPGIARYWDVSRAVAAAYAAGEPLRLALYSADTHYNSGRYFVTSDEGAWNAAARPTLRVSWGTTFDVTDQLYMPIANR